ncbi:response regulator receiver modulated metal dependent phosphohydrolase [Sphaerotilus hippei]|uniref:Response regulator receiver modulated metal dependent phosphohydrolase n=1 Tax=Sphaerotilus hippei TaxID=744406 RepID=A0A318GZ21_9BURK|nr:HD domain-containing phosphohydrolase [Sphaerotilus hippei]PXW95459.1 response regulator receiver modulated metal dependent phosphohydrolase [Sphaerotilus hippei]
MTTPPTSPADRPSVDLRPRLLLVDDEPANLQVLRLILQKDYRLAFARDGEKALELAAQEPPDLVLLDVMMPGLSGLDVCRQLRAQAATRHVPVIFVTALSDPQHEAEGFDAGAVDYITKPVSGPIVLARVRNHLSLVAAEALRASRLAIVQCLGRAGEYRDNETGLHVMRMSHFAQLVGRAMGMSDSQADDLLNAAALHDVGKIGIPDAILLKPGALDEAEWAHMRRHPAMGAEIIGEHPDAMLQMARRVALCHHEKWDGSGYPQGLAGTDIPLEARIVALADVFDALTSVRPYKPAWEIERAVALLQEQSGRHFDPEVVRHFIANLPAALVIRERWADR